MEFLFGPSQGNSGGILSIWDSSFFLLESPQIYQHWIALSGSISSLNFQCTLLNIYNPCSAKLRAVVWNEITSFWETSLLPCLVLEDLNDKLSPHKRGSNLFLTNGAHDFQSFLEVIQVKDIPSSNGWFTWFRGYSKSKLYRLFFDLDWVSNFPSLKLTKLKHKVSNQCPLLVSSHDTNMGPCPFRFHDIWLSHPGYLKFIKDSWAISNGPIS